MSSITISKKKTIWVLFCLCLLAEYLMPHSTASSVLVLLFALLCGIYLFRRYRYIRSNPFINSYILFLLWQVFLLVAGYTAHPDVTASYIATLAICALFIFIVYNFFVIYGDTRMIENSLIIAGVVALAIVMFLCRDSLLTGRMAHTYKDYGKGYSYILFGVKVAISSNLIASYSTVSAFLLLKHFYEDRKCACLPVIAFLSVGILLTGSRKGILLLVSMLAITAVIYGRSEILIKVVLAIVGVVTSYFIITRVEILRNVIGDRLRALVLRMLGLANIKEASLNARLRFGGLALDYIRNNPIVGIGSGGFSYEVGNVSENNYTEILLAGGFIGFLLYYSYLIPSAVGMIRKIKRSSGRLLLEYLEYSALFLMLHVIQYGTVIYYSRPYLLYAILLFSVMAIKRKDRETV